jgi:hypothetical protein
MTVMHGLQLPMIPSLVGHNIFLVQRKQEDIDHCCESPVLLNGEDGSRFVNGNMSRQSSQDISCHSAAQFAACMSAENPSKNG